MLSLRRALIAAATVAALAAPQAQAASIVGGQDTTTAKWPYAVHIDGLVYACTGTLLAPGWVLTAAHCISPVGTAGPVFPAAHITATVGSDVPYSGAGRSAIGLLAYTHPSYTGVDHRYDVALINLATPLNGVATAKVIGPNETALAAPGVRSTIIGWGDVREGGPAADVLQEAQVPIVDDPTCSNLIGGFAPGVMLCAGYVGVGGVDTCQGDSGGPLLVPAGAGFRQAGVTSFGNGCARPNDPGAYTELGAPEIRDFIAGHVPAAISTGTARAAAPKKVRAKKRKRARRAPRRR